MRKNRYSKIRESLTMDSLVGFLRKEFSKFKDHRASNTVHSLSDIFMCGFAMFSLKYSSLLEFENQNCVESQNLQSVFGVSSSCSDSTMRRCLDVQSEKGLKAIQEQLISQLESAGILKDYQVLGKYTVVSVDGVEYFRSKKVHCDHCQECQHKDGTISYSHSMLCAAIVSPGKREVFMLNQEPIQKADGATKNDCELNANKRLLEQLGAKYKGYPFLFVEDAIFSNGPNLEIIIENGWEYIINVKPDSHTSLFAQFEGRTQRGHTKIEQYSKDGESHHFEWANNLALNGTHSTIRVNFLKYQKTDVKGVVTTFTWITGIKISKRNVEKIATIGRSRWKIENETFNTLKNQGYHFEHNYGHGKENLSTILAHLMLLAFFIDQLIQYCNKDFQQIWKAAKTKKKLWANLRAVFLTILVDSFDKIYQKLAFLFSIQLE